MSVKKRIMLFLALFAFFFTLGGEMLLSAFSITASAETFSYSNVLDDLKKDPSFDPNDFKIDSDDYSLNVIQIAESDDGKLFLYIHQPNFEFSNAKASYINLSFQDQRDKSIELKYELHPLTFLNSDGVFCKYLVNNYEVPTTTNRYYSVAGVYRPYLSDIDTTYEAIDSKQHVKYEVGKLWCAYAYNNSLTYESYDIDIAGVDITATGDLLYKEGGFKLYVGACASHYMAFKISNYDVTQIFDADVSYQLIPYLETVLSDARIDESREKIVKESETLYDNQFVTYESGGVLGGLFNKKYKWERIQTVDEFKDDAKALGYKFSDTELEGLNQADFVFRVAETPYNITLDYVYGDHVYSYYRMETAGVLRLHFATPGGVYNLGAVSDLVGTDGRPDAVIDPTGNDENFKFLVGLISLIILLSALQIIFPVLGTVYKVVFDIFYFVIKWIVKLLLLPFRLVGRLCSR